MHMHHDLFPPYSFHPCFTLFSQNVCAEFVEIGRLPRNHQFFSFIYQISKQDPLVVKLYQFIWSICFEVSGVIRKVKKF